jgi:hypothetical protein
MVTHRFINTNGILIFSAGKLSPTYQGYFRAKLIANNLALNHFIFAD